MNVYQETGGLSIFIRELWYRLESLEFCFEIVIRSGKIFHISQSIGKITRDRKKKKRTKTKEKNIYIFRTKTIKKEYIYIYI